MNNNKGGTINIKLKLNEKININFKYEVLRF